jgi:hypothetical protein
MGNKYINRLKIIFKEEKYMTLTRKRYDRNITPIIIVATVLSIWAILAIEIEMLPKIAINKSQAYINGLNRIYLGLAYSYIAGLILWGFTVAWPVYREKRRLQPIINEKFEDIGVMLANMIVGFPPIGNKPEISDIEKCVTLLKSADWNRINSMPQYATGQNKLYQTFKTDFEEIQICIHNLILCYKPQLSTDQLLLLENIRNAQFMPYLKLFVKANIVIPDSGADFIVDFFAEVLKTYKKLKETIDN